MPHPLFEKFTSHLKSVIRSAVALCRALHHTTVKPEHFLWALLRQKGSLAAEVLQKAGLTAEELKGFVMERNIPVVTQNPHLHAEPQLSEEAKQALERAVFLANQYDHRYVGTEHLLAAIMKLDYPPIHDLLAVHRLRVPDIQQHLVVILKNTSKFPDLANLFDQSALGEEESFAQGGPRRDQRSALDYFCLDLTDAQFQETVDPVIGREKEIDRLIQILSRRTKNNPVLIGDPGVGKTAIVEGLAKRILAGSVPSVLLGKKLLTLDLSLLVAGTMYRGEFEGRMKQVIEEVRANPNIILFIDELHTIIGAGGASGALDAANMLKPALAKGHLRCIGATTLDEYHKHIESDAALERRFQPIVVNEPSVEETVAILKGVKRQYEHYHRVAITDDAIRAAVGLSNRYVQEKFQPDKAIDVLDEAASKKKIASGNETRARQLAELEQQLERVREKKQEAVQRESFPAAVELKTNEDALLRTIEALKHEEETETAQRRVAVTDRDIADVVSGMTGIPLAAVLEEEQEKLLHLERDLKRFIVGQDDALTAIADCIRRGRIGVSSPDRPLGSFIFLGPSGVGKTETAKVLARVVFGSDDALIRFDMSEYGESFQTSKLIGAPAGYVGYKEGGALTESVKHRPYAVLLFDEIEKAHPDIFNLLLQILDEGHLTDAVGKTVNFKNTIVIFTSNIGLAELTRHASIGFQQQTDDAAPDFARIEEIVLTELREQFRPEFLNRIDHTIVFRPLTKSNSEKIAELHLQTLADRLLAKGTALTFDTYVIRWIANQGFNADQGARRIRTVIQNEVEKLLASHLLTSGAAQHVALSVKHERIVILPTTTKPRRVKAAALSSV